MIRGSPDPFPIFEGGVKLRQTKVRCDRRTDRHPTTVTLAAHARRGLRRTQRSVISMRLVILVVDRKLYFEKNLPTPLLKRGSHPFGQIIRKLKNSSSSFAPGRSVFASKLEYILNTHSSSSHSSLQSSIQSAVTVSDVSGVYFSENDVLTPEAWYISLQWGWNLCGASDLCLFSSSILYLLFLPILAH